MLNWWLIAIFSALALFGFFHIDKKLVVLVEKIRRQFHPSIHHFFGAVSFTPFVVLTLYFIPAVFVFKFIDFFSVAALTLACLLATGSAFIVKYLFKRVRPFGHTTYLGKIDSAFPSAHAAGSFVAAFTLAFFWPAWSIPFFILAALVAISRIYLELHFFSDVMGGILLAYIMTAFALDSQILLFLGF
jgi:undecaprenyl-diphosphatase